jgi:membrane-associated PAP2 superfamily phosphatase
MHKGNTAVPRWRLERTLPWAGAALAIVFVGFEVTNADLAVQDALFDFTRGRWRVNGYDPLWRAWFYSGPKLLLIVFGAVTLVLTAGPARWRARTGLAEVSRVGLGALVLTLGTTPALVGGGKAVTNVFCPSEIRRYGGDVCYVRVLEAFPPADRPTRKGHCFPAGHASGGFALMALAGIARTRRGQYLGVAVGLIVGGVMSAYQMAKGAHYLSHTLITALLAWIVFVVWIRWLHWWENRAWLPWRTQRPRRAASDVSAPLDREKKLGRISTCGNSPASA